MNKKREKVLERSKGHCWYCGANLTDTRWQVDHFYPVIRINGKMIYPELDTIENLVPSCAPCNNFKSSSNIEGFRFRVAEQFVNVPGKSTGMRQLLRLGLADITEKPVVFWFEKHGLKVKPEAEICKISIEAQNVVWKKDEQEIDYFSAAFEGFICSVRRMGSYWLAIAITYDWEEIGRTEIPNDRFVKAQAADWALSLKKTN